jgi:ABC-type multidrug transport system fused ATPase/permease subunit
MHNGKVAEQGSYTQLMAAGGPFAAMMKEVQVGSQWG